jgi:hypothetical protein
MLNKLKNLFKKPVTPEVVIEPVIEKPKKPRKPRVKKVKVEPVPVVKTEKQKATEAGEPYVNILSVDVDPTNINSGAFELDWNDKFILNLIKAGYKIKEDDVDSDIVERWFQTVCRNIALEVYEQTQADPDNRDMRRHVSTKDLGDGRTEVS